MAPSVETLGRISEIQAFTGRLECARPGDSSTNWRHKFVESIRHASCSMNTEQKFALVDTSMKRGLETQQKSY